MNKPVKKKPINLEPEDHARIDDLRRRLIAKNGKMVYLSETVMEGIKLLERKVEKS